VEVRAAAMFVYMWRHFRSRDFVYMRNLCLHCDVTSGHVTESRDRKCNLIGRGRGMWRHFRSRDRFLQPDGSGGGTCHICSITTLAIIHVIRKLFDLRYCNGSYEDIYLKLWRSSRFLWNVCKLLVDNRTLQRSGQQSSGDYLFVWKFVGLSISMINKWKFD
jgi:hypothetical protein